MANDLIAPQLLDQSILFARFAAAAYLDTSAQAQLGLEKLKNELRLNEDNSANQTETQALLVRWNNDVVIAFRGTESNLSDWWTDLKGELVANSFGKGRLHKGFKTAADSVYQHVVRYIKNVATDKSRLFVCGHSLGGALAQLTASRLAADSSLPPLRGVFTYGAPRLGDGEFANAYRESQTGQMTNLWVATGDPVTHVAPHSFDYRHVVAKQFTLKEGAIGITDLDSLIEIQSQQAFFNGFPKIQGVLGMFSRLKNAFQNLDTAEHSITESYLKQLLVAKG